MNREEYAGLGLLLLGELRASDTLVPVPVLAMEKLESAILSIPPQFNQLGLDKLFGDWLTVAAAIESQGLHDIAFDLLEEMRRLQVRELEKDPDRVAAASIWLRRARIARTSGQLDDAEICYGEAFHLVPRPLPSDANPWWSDILPMVWIGRGVLAMERGNYPNAEREISKVMDKRVPDIWRIYGHFVMSTILRKRTRAVEAMSHIWAAIDLLDENDSRRAESLVLLGEVLMGLGERSFAVQAHLSALACEPVLRVQAAALCGIQTLIGNAERHSTRELDRILRESIWARRNLAQREEEGFFNRLIGYVENLLAEVPVSLKASGQTTAGVVGGLTRHDQSILARGLAELLESQGRHADALEWLTIVEQIAELYDLHERKFEVDALRLRWTAHVRDETKKTARIAGSGRKKIGAVWTRMADLEALSKFERVEGH